MLGRKIYSDPIITGSYEALSIEITDWWIDSSMVELLPLCVMFIHLVKVTLCMRFSYMHILNFKQEDNRIATVYMGERKEVKRAVEATDGRFLFGALIDVYDHSNNEKQ